MAYNDNLAAFSESARRALVSLSPLTELRHRDCISDELARKSWQTAVDLGWTAICAPEEFGGLALDIEYLCALGLEIGKSLTAGPFAENLALAPVLGTLIGGQFADTLLPAIVRGEIVLTSATAMQNDRAAPAADHGAIDGVDCVFEHAAVATHALILRVKRTSARASVYIEQLDLRVAPEAVTPTELFDPTSRGGRLSLQHTAPGSRQRWSCTMDAEELERLLLPMRLFTAAQAVGVAQQALQLTVAHTTNRKQFGQPLGAFQAVKHHLANVHLEIEKARVLVQYAARDLAGGGSTAFLDAHCAWLAATAAAVTSSQTCLQLHGAMGFSWEHPLHLLLKRAHSLAVKFVGVLESRCVIANAIGELAIPGAVESEVRADTQRQEA